MECDQINFTAVHAVVRKMSTHTVHPLLLGRRTAMSGSETIIHLSWAPSNLLDKLLFFFFSCIPCWIFAGSPTLARTFAYVTVFM